MFETSEEATTTRENDPSFHERHWGHTTGLLQGTLAIDRIEALPESFRVGLFARNQSFPVVCRPNAIDDKKAGLSANRMAVKVKYSDSVPNVYAPSGEAHELDLLMAEGSSEENGVGQAFFIRDAREFALLVSLSPPSMKTVETLLSARNWAVLLRVFKRLKTSGAALETLSPTEFADRQAVEFDAVPTGIAAHDGRLYVSLFGGFPFLPGSGKVVSLPDGGAPTAR